MTKSNVQFSEMGEASDHVARCVPGRFGTLVDGAVNPTHRGEVREAGLVAGGEVGSGECEGFVYAEGVEGEVEGFEGGQMGSGSADCEGEEGVERDELEGVVCVDVVEEFGVTGERVSMLSFLLDVFSI